MKTRATVVLLLVALLLAGNAQPVMADTVDYGMSKTTVRPGEATVLTEIDPCPIPTNEWGGSVRVKFTDGLGRESDHVTEYDENGHWLHPVFLAPPHMRVQSYDPLVYSSDSWPGAGTVEVKCVDDDFGTTTLEYPSKTLTVSGSSASMKVIPSRLKAGQPGSIESMTPCPSGTATVDVSLLNGVTTDSLDNTVIPDINGEWTANFTVPSSFPEGYASVLAFCRPPNHGGNLTMAYGETVAWVKSSKFIYAAWGDSYSSGEGVEPFEVSGGSCHRSVDAYPRVLEQNSSLKLRLSDAFVACSGAVTSAITLGDGTNSPQMDTLSVDTDLVTMTIGGNNMRFAEFAAACAFPIQGDACTIGGSATNTAMARVINDVIPDVQYMLETVRDELITSDNTDATVLVMGYPQIVPSTWSSSSTGCDWLDSDETPAIRHVITQLNTAIKNEVEAIGYNFHFLSANASGSPFAGHELCRPSTDTEPNFFNNVNASNPVEFTFHPNQAGQEAYAELIEDWLNANPLNE